jgi:hypothetical protein
MNIRLWTIAAGILAAVFVVWWFLPSASERLEPPEVLQERVLQGTTVEVQAEAAQAMVRHGPAAQPFIRQALAEYRGNDADVLVPLLQGAQRQRDWRNMNRLFELMEHADPRVRGKAGAAVVEIMGADYGFAASDPPAKRREVLGRMRAVYEKMKPKVEEYYRNQEQ